MENTCEMLIDGVFHLFSGFTAFVGRIPNYEKRVPPCVCEILKDDSILLEIEITGETFLLRDLGSENTLRSIFTSENVNLNEEMLSKNQYKLKCYPERAKK